ncbi:HindVP family restriction endonuclease [Flavicella sp.]|uniref:HindVP family restriction endonuclease n=1 Tax=Flavicella sp. TaxID=2957742 RepID=UPI003016CDD4
MSDKPGLYGIKNSNRDFTQKNSWGKNQFNSSFPASLSAYLSHKNLENNYIKLGNDLKVEHSSISTTKLFGINPKSEKIFFAFESIHNPFQPFVIGTLPRVDLVIQDMDGNCLSGIEIKLTALPDNTTCNFSENRYGTEIVIRPDTIVYLACSIAQNFKDKRNDLKTYFPEKFDTITDWSEIENVLPFIKEMVSILDKISHSIIDSQKPIVMQPIWKTEGKSPRLTENCLDVFVWSDLGFMQLFLDAGRGEKELTKINRQVRTIVWLFKMLFEFSKNGQFDHHKIIDELSYNTKNDKAFAVSGMVTHPYMTSEYLTKPRITREELKNIILGGGQNLLSPERRFDAIIYNSPELF